MIKSNRRSKLIVNEVAKSSSTSTSSFKDGVQLEQKQTRLSKQQLMLLRFLYSRRFVTTKQVQTFLGAAHIQQAQQRLNTLLNKAYIGRHYSNEDKLLGRYATYFLLPNGMELIQGYVSRHALRLMKKDVTASERFMQHSIAIGDVATDFLALYPAPAYDTHFMTKTDVMKCDADQYDGSLDYQPWSASFPKPFPDGFFSTTEAEDWSGFCDAFVEIWHGAIPFWVYRKRILYYIDYFDEETWKDVMTNDRLIILLICDTPTLQRRVQRYLRRISDSIYDETLQFLVTNRQLLKTAGTDNAIWTRVGEDENEVIKLIDLAKEE